MSENSDLAYYRQRERTCREQSTTARNSAVASIHGEMADRYAELARGGPGANLPDRGGDVKSAPLDP